MTLLAAGQTTLSEQMTSLIQRVLNAWHAQGRVQPRLAYLTDAGFHPNDYYLRVLRHLANPWQPGKKLIWQWIVDFWHACGYVNKLAESLFGNGVRAWGWFRKWRHWLRDREQGLANVLRSVMWHYNHGKQTKSAEKAFWDAYRYLRKHGVWMKYASYRKAGMPIGSGVTEAACKTVFAERLKRSGMTWSLAGGQVILDLRVLVLSKVWRETHQAYMGSRRQAEVVQPASQGIDKGPAFKIAA